MRKIYKNIISFILVLSMIFCMSVPAFAAGAAEYISELRLIYAEDYEEAMEILSEGEFSDYKLLNENLNEDSDEIGVWLAYKTTTNIDDAITDLAVMQMNGGYTLGNYQEMIEQSYNEYVAMGEIYLQAIDYFIEAYDAGHFLAESAFRQLNFYNGFDEREDERLGDVFYDGVDEYELATMFMQGNSYALSNIRSLIAMGVSYNEDGTTYLRRVEMEVNWLQNDPDLYEDEDYEELAFLISPTITVFKEMFKELAAYDDELDYTDDELTSLETKYMEYKAIAVMMSEIEYLDGETLYDFCLGYEVNEDDYSALYPLVAALNDGQIAMTKVAHYYDVVRYSMGVYPENTINEKLEEYEEKYSENPFDIYTGVDRTIYNGSFALTSAASRGDSYNETSLAEAFFGEDNLGSTGANIATFLLGGALWALAIDIGGTSGGATTGGAAAGTVSETVVDALETQYLTDLTELASQKTSLVIGAKYITTTKGEAVHQYLTNYLAYKGETIDISSWTFEQKLSYMDSNVTGPWTDNMLSPTRMEYAAYKKISGEASHFKTEAVKTGQSTAEQSTQNAVETASSSSSTGISFTAGLLYVAGGILMLYSAFRLGKTVYDYYHPTYEDVPLSMVDLVDTVDGDRFIKYDVVYNAETNDDGVYEAGDLNAFEAQRWNALYYTKSYEAGKPLLADNFVVSNNNNKAASGYTPVHRFGDVVCYDLNKYNFDGDTSIYLSVKQSKNDKSAVADVPEVVGSMFGAGFLFLAGGIGAIAGVGGVLATQEIIKRKKTGSAEQGEDIAQAEE